LGFFVFLTFFPSGNAKTYEYVDKNGVPHYTNVPNDPQYKPASGFVNQSPKKKIQNPVKKLRPDTNPHSPAIPQIFPAVLQAQNPTDFERKSQENSANSPLIFFPI